MYILQIISHFFLFSNHLETSNILPIFLKYDTNNKLMDKQNIYDESNVRIIEDTSKLRQSRRKEKKKRETIVKRKLRYKK